MSPLDGLTLRRSITECQIIAKSRKTNAFFLKKKILTAKGRLMSLLLRDLLAQQAQERSARKRETEQQPTAPVFWRGFWTFYSQRCGSFKTAFIEERVEKLRHAVHAQWREHGKAFVADGVLSESLTLLIAATIHCDDDDVYDPMLASDCEPAPRDEADAKSCCMRKRFVSPLCLRVGHGHCTLRGNYDWDFRYPQGTDPVVFFRSEPTCIVLYSTACEGDGAAEVADPAAPGTVLSPVRTRRCVNALRSVATTISEMCALDSALFEAAPVVTTSEEHVGAHSVVSRNTFTSMLERNEFALHWHEGGEFDTSERNGITKDNIEEVTQQRTRFCLIGTDMRGVACLRLHRVYALLIHLDVNPNADVHICGLKTPSEVDCYPTLSGVFQSTTDAAKALASYLKPRMPQYHLGADSTTLVAPE